MAAPEIRRIRSLNGRRIFVDVPFRIHGGDPNWVPPLRVTVYDRISPKHPANAHQETALWVAYRHGRPVGRIGACIDSLFNEHSGEKWGWVGFYDTFDDPEVATALFDTACSWAKGKGAETCVGPANFTTNDELGLLVEGFDEPTSILTLQNPPYYEKLWTSNGWEQAMDLWGWHFYKSSTDLNERQRRTLDRLQKRAKVRVRSVNMDDYDNDVGKLFEVYNAAWEDNWGFAPMPEVEIRHMAKQFKQIIRPEWVFGLEIEDGTVVAVCVTLPDMNLPMRKVRSGRLFPFGWYPLLTQRKKVPKARVWALGIRPDYQHLALGPLLYREIVDRLAADPYITESEGGWTLATNHRINNQLEGMGATVSKVWRLYQKAL